MWPLLLGWTLLLCGSLVPRARGSRRVVGRLVDGDGAGTTYAAVASPIPLKCGPREGIAFGVSGSPRR